MNNNFIKCTLITKSYCENAFYKKQILFSHLTKFNMKFFKQILLSFLLLISIMILPNLLYAGPGDPCVDPFDPDCPIDDNVIILIAGVILLAAIKACLFYKQKLAK